MSYKEPLAQMFDRSVIMVLDFSQIPSGTPPAQDISSFFADQIATNQNPRLPQNRQRFNNTMLQDTNARYLVSRYGEDRSAMLQGSQIAKEGRVLHMGVDIFSQELEAVFAPCDGQVVRAGREEQDHGYGYYVIIKPDDSDYYFFFGHLSKDLPALGPIKAGQPFAKLGDYTNNENGGWSRHLHLQVCKQLPPEGQTPIGYSSKQEFEINTKLFPSPFPLFPAWQI